MRTFVIVMVALVTATAAFGAVLRVPQDYSTIHMAWTAAATNDTILLASGYYTENIGLFEKGVLIKSEFGRDSTFWSPAVAGADIVYIDNCAGFTNRFEGITFTGATLYSCINSFSGDVYVIDCAFIGNSTHANYRATLDLGFGNYIIRGNRFVDNYSSDQGGGTQFESAQWAIVEDNEFIKNRAIHGGGISMTNSFGVIVRRNLFYGNMAASNGGAIYVGTAANSIIYNNTIDSCRSAQEVGGGLTFISSSNDTVYNNIITRCEGYGIYSVAATGIVDDYNNVYGNAPGGYEGLTAGANTISLDPQFVGGNPFDYRLQSTSPCINTGNPLARFNDPDGSRNDMGAYPSASSPTEFNLLSPANSVTPPLDDRTPNFRWNASVATGSVPGVTYTLSISNDEAFTSPAETAGISDTAYTLINPVNWGTRYWWKVKASDTVGGERWSNQVFTFRTMMIGDVDANFMIDISDVVYLVNYIFAHGPVPIPMASANVNCDTRTNLGDAVYLINYIFAGGPAPCAP